MDNLYFPICALLIAILIFIVFFAKKRIKNEETRAYSFLIIINLIETILACIIILITKKYGVPPFLYILHRLDYALILFWIWSLFFYVFNVSFSYQSKIKIGIEKITISLNIIFIIVIFFLDLHVINANGVIDTYGEATSFLYGIVAIYVLLILIFVFKSLKKDLRNSNNRKYIPLIFLVGLAIGMLVIRQIYPEVILISFVAAYADLIMFFTIENPDIKMIYELNRNRKLIENSNEEKINFLFNISQEIRNPINNIIELNDDIKNTKDKELITQYLKDIENNAKNLKVLVNNVLDVSTLNSTSLIINNDTYNVYNLFDSIIKMASGKISEKAQFRYNISKGLPKEVHGDSVKLKQVIMTVLINAIEHTKDGFIEINVNEITKYNVCRLIITVEDSGCGMSLDKVNDLLNSNDDLTMNEISKLSDLNLNLKIISKMLKLMGGFMSIKSEKDKGSTFTIVIDQKIVHDSKGNEYNKYLFNKKKILLVSDKKSTLDKIKYLIRNFNAEVLTVMYGQDCVERVKNKESFDLILLEDEMQPDSALTTLKNLESLNNFKVPTVVMLGKNKEKIKDYYLDDGFDDYLLKDNIEEETKRILKKYI